MAHRKVVLEMASERPISARSVAERLAIEPKYACKLLHRWELKGLLLREKLDEMSTHPRLSYVITADGRRLIDSNKQKRLDFEPLAAALGFPCQQVLARFAGAQPSVVRKYNWET